jgi:DNA-binding NtrC family response regulator
VLEHLEQELVRDALDRSQGDRARAARMLVMRRKQSGDPI